MIMTVRLLLGRSRDLPHQATPSPVGADSAHMTHFPACATGEIRSPHRFYVTHCGQLLEQLLEQDLEQDLEQALAGKLQSTGGLVPAMLLPRWMRRWKADLQSLD